MDMIDLRVSRRDVGRLLVVVRERRKKLERGMEKFKGNFDPVAGANILDGFNAYTEIERMLNEAIDPRSAGRNPRKHQGRRDAPGDYRPARQ